MAVAVGVFVAQPQFALGLLLSSFVASGRRLWRRRTCDALQELALVVGRATADDELAVLDGLCPRSRLGFARLAEQIGPDVAALVFLPPCCRLAGGGDGRHIFNQFSLE